MWLLHFKKGREDLGFQERHQFGKLKTGAYVLKKMGSGYLHQFLFTPFP